MAVFWCPVFAGHLLHSVEKVGRYSPIQSSCLIRLCSSNRNEPEIKRPGRIKTFIVKKYINYLERFNDTFERKYPKVYKVYKLFRDGVRDFFVDTKTYYSVATDIWSGKPLGSFTRKELQIYQQMPGDMIRSAPILIAVPLPFLPYVVFPIAYMFPRHLLCRHFWTSEQRLEFAQQDLKQRLTYYPKILRYLETHSLSIRDVEKRKMFTYILYQISKGNDPDVEAILDVKDVFATFPFDVEHLVKRHKIYLWNLCRSLDLSTRTKKLFPALSFFHNLDLSILREGVDELSTPDLQQLCFLRGLNAIEVEDEDLRKYLKDWLRISSTIDESSFSLLLHCPVLLSTTRPSNKKLVSSLNTTRQ